MARNEKVTKKHNAPTKTTASNDIAVWKIRGTDHTAVDKESLKPKRRELNAASGVYEVATTIDGKVVEATPSNNWPYRIAKGPDHPHKSPTFGDINIGFCFSFNGTVYRKTERNLAVTYTDKVRTAFVEHTRVIG